MLSTMLNPLGFDVFVLLISSQKLVEFSGRHKNISLSRHELVISREEQISNLIYTNHIFLESALVRIPIKLLVQITCD